jgi:hypothetical protein
MRLRRRDRRPSGPAKRAPPGRALPFALLVGLVACGVEPDGSPAVDSSDPAGGAPDPVPISGIYDVKGTTTPVGGGEGRPIAGTVTLKQTGDRYSASFKLDTTFPGADEPLQADVIGSGQGTVSGRTLTGSTKTQLIVSTIPGIDTEFAFIPRIVGARVESTSLTEISADGQVYIELQNHPAEGEDYQPTRTILSGQRVAEGASIRPDVAAPAPRN